MGLGSPAGSCARDAFQRAGRGEQGLRGITAFSSSLWLIPKRERWAGTRLPSCEEHGDLVLTWVALTPRWARFGKVLVCWRLCTHTHTHTHMHARLYIQCIYSQTPCVFPANILLVWVLMNRRRASAMANQQTLILQKEQKRGFALIDGKLVIPYGLLLRAPAALIPSAVP